MTGCGVAMEDVKQESKVIPGAEQGEAKKPFEPKNLGRLIDVFLHRVNDIEDCAREYIYLAEEKYKKDLDKLMELMSGQQNLLKNGDKANRRLAVGGIAESIREVSRLISSSPVLTLEKSLFIFLFSVLDKYIGDLVNGVYILRADLLKGINREISLSEAMEYDSIEELKSAILDKEIETLKRKSYIDQFKDLGNRFSIKLTEFEEWPTFVERTQRRNLFTHCDGVVSQQYLDVCKSVKCKADSEVKVGDQLEIGVDYLLDSCELVANVGIMLGHTLWRKLLPDSLADADTHLHTTVFDCLSHEKWNNAIRISKFSLGLPSESTDEMERIVHVNYAIALKAIGNQVAAKSILDRKDWSATSYDFKLAYAVLVDDFDKAKEIMMKIGKEGDLVTESAYHKWPLFREYRDSSQFLSAYHEIYGYAYESKLNELAECMKMSLDGAE